MSKERDPKSKTFQKQNARQQIRQGCRENEMGIKRKNCQEKKVSRKEVSRQSDSMTKRCRRKELQRERDVERKRFPLKERGGARKDVERKGCQEKEMSKKHCQEKVVTPEKVDKRKICQGKAARRKWCPKELTRSGVPEEKDFMGRDAKKGDTEVTFGSYRLPLGNYRGPACRGLYSCSK